jgi:hypothetical protein
MQTVQRVVVAAAMIGVAWPADAQTGWTPTFAGGASVEGTSGIYFAMGTLLSAEMRAGVERREAGTAPLFAVSGSYGRATDLPSAASCPLIAGAFCPSGPLPQVLSGMVWLGARHASTRSRWSWRAMAGVGVLRVWGRYIQTRDGTDTADSYQLGVRGEVDRALTDRVGLLIGGQYIDAARVEAGMRRGGLSVGVRWR